MVVLVGTEEPSLRGVYAEGLHLPCAGLRETQDRPFPQCALGSEPGIVTTKPACISVPANPGGRMKVNRTGFTEALFSLPDSFSFSSL